MLEKCPICSGKKPKFTRHSSYNKKLPAKYQTEKYKTINVPIIQCNLCKNTKALLPSFLISEKGISSEKRQGIAEKLFDKTLNQKEIAELFQVSESTVSRIKQTILNLNSNKLRAEIIQTDKNYPPSELKDTTNSLPERNTEKIKLRKNLQLLKKWYKVKIYEAADYIKKIMNPISYYLFVNKNIKIITVKIE